MTDHTIQPGDNIAETMRKTMQEFGHYEEIEPRSPNYTFNQSHQITVPKGRDLRDLTDSIRAAAQYLKPARRKGTAQLTDLQSLIGWTNRFKGDTSSLFANPDMKHPSLTCVADYHAQGAADQTNPTGDPTARHCHHKAIYNFPLSDEWKAWMAISGEALEKDGMGEFVEANSKDIMDPTPTIIGGKISNKNQSWENRLIETAQQIEGRFGQLTQLLAMSRLFQVYETSNLRVGSNRDTGEGEIQFLNEHNDAEGKPLKIPNLIIIAIPVFRGGASYRMPVRFRYRKMSSKVYFIMSIYNPEKAFKAAFDEAIEQAVKDTKLPMFMGEPES